MNSLAKISVSAVWLSAFPMMAHAHPGHIDAAGETHSHWIGLALALAAAGGAAAYYVIQRRSKARAAARRETV
ncbi:MAG TPA: hypothetical protein PK405_02475 [Hyphomicrobiales bacterium]|nr:hypothetical protein [Rhodobiaceae bacterium]HXK53527.1 hypothetical protein [Hyphomicrobiales bacterium]